MVALLCFSTSCKKGGGDEPTPNNPGTNTGGDKPNTEPQETAKFLTATEFQNSYWKGKQKDEEISGIVELKITAAQMVLSYYYKEGLSKNNKEYKLKTVNIEPYTFDEKTAKFSGTGNDKITYAGELTSKTQLSITLPNETVALTKQ